MYKPRKVYSDEPSLLVFLLCLSWVGLLPLSVQIGQDRGSQNRMVEQSSSQNLIRAFSPAGIVSVVAGIKSSPLAMNSEIR